MGRDATGRFDFIIVGGGSAGCALAGRLSADGRSRVLLVEAGSTNRGLNVRIPALLESVNGHPKYDWSYPVAADPSRGGRVDKWPGGRGLGGGSAINGMLYVRGGRADFDQWAQMGATGWSYEDVLPYFRRAETNENGADAWHGGDGPLSVSNVRAPHPLVDVLAAAAEEAGLPRNPDVNGAEQEGFGPAQATQRAGLRCSAAFAYLDAAARRRPNLAIVTDALVERVLIEGGRAVGIRYERGGQSTEARCDREVIVSAGAIGSPKILLLSGIGPSDELSAAGVTVHRDLPGVGRNLQEHPHVNLNQPVKIWTINTEQTPLRVARHAVRWLFTRSGLLSTPAAHAVGFARTLDHLAAPDIQLTFSPFAWTVTPDGKTILPPESAVSMSVNVCRPVHRGVVRLRSGDFRLPPVIEHKLLGGPEDVATLVRGLRLARRIFRASAMAPFVNGADEGPRDEGDAAWENFARANAFPGYHLAGTCRIGRGPDAVVDPALRVIGIEGLRVADASVMPIVVSANTNAASIMIGEKAADHVLGRAAA